MKIKQVFSVSIQRVAEVPQFCYTLLEKRDLQFTEISEDVNLFNRIQASKVLRVSGLATRCFLLQCLFPLPLTRGMQR